MSTELDLKHFRIDPLPDGTTNAETQRNGKLNQNVHGNIPPHDTSEEQVVIKVEPQMKAKRYPSPLPAPQPRQKQQAEPNQVPPNNASFDDELQRKLANQKQSKIKTYASRNNGNKMVEVQVEQKQEEANKAKPVENTKKVAEAEESNISELEAYVNKYGNRPQNASQLMQFSKIDPRFKPLTFMQARKQLADNKKSKNGEKNVNGASDKKQAKKPVSKKQNGFKKVPKPNPNQDQFVPPPPANPPQGKDNKVTNNKKRAMPKANGNGHSNGKHGGNAKGKVQSIWDVNENEGDDPMGATFKKKEILSAYHESAIVEQTAESMAKQQMGMISPMTHRMRSVFDESSSDEEDEGGKAKQQKQDDRLTINVRNAKHNVTAHFKMQL